MNDLFKASIHSTREDLPTLIEEVKSFLKPHALDSHAENAIQLVLEEAILNIIQHGYNDGELHRIGIKIQVESDQVAIELTDDGRQFNPLSLPHRQPDTDMPEEADSELGIHLVRSMMRSMAYRREEGKNIFEIWIRR